MPADLRRVFIQFVLQQMYYSPVEVVDDSELHVVPTERNDGGFGSTDLE